MASTQGKRENVRRDQNKVTFLKLHSYTFIIFINLIFFKYLYTQTNWLMKLCFDDKGGGDQASYTAFTKGLKASCWPESEKCVNLTH